MFAMPVKFMSAVVMVLLSAPAALAITEGGSTSEYNYNPFGESLVVETAEDFTLLFLIMMILILILYKGEVTIENLMKINERIKERKAIKDKRKKIWKRIREKNKARKKR